jgi:uncharacterized protein YceK
MKKITPYLLSIFIVICMSGASAVACSVFNASGVDKVYAATNKDWNNKNTRIRFYAPSEGKYGRVYFGYQIPEGFQNVGGMNEHGLWYDGASLPSRSDIYNHFNKPTVKGELCEKALEECATVEEVIQLYKHFYTPHWQGHSMWADRSGNSVIIEYGEKDVVFLTKKQGYQVMTNYYLSDSANLRWSNCHRFNAITEILKNGKELNVELMTRALDAAHKEGLTPTLFSNIYDLKKGEIYVYHFHYYGEFVCINLAEELEKGDQYLDLPQLFYGIKLISPSPDLAIDGTEVCFEWSGGASEYEVHYSVDREFNDFNSVRVQNSLPSETQMLSYLPFCITLFIAWSIGRRKKQFMMMLFGLMLLGSCSSCSKIFISPQLPDSLNFSAWAKNLDLGTTYHWKIVALGEDGINCESIVRTFATID